MSREKNQEYLDAMHFIDENGNPLPKRTRGFYEWISVKDRLPEDYTFVLVYSHMPGESEPCPITIARWNTEEWETLCNENQNNACASGDLFRSTESEEITHWMPLPKPPVII
jgi:hypothetical protein